MFVCSFFLSEGLVVAIPIPHPRRVSRRRKSPSLVGRDMAFLDSIESSWKGHERFAAWLVQRTNPKVVVDLGFDRGLSTLAFACRNRGHVFGIDWFEEGNYAVKSYALDSAFRNISDAIRFNYVKNIHLIIGPFSDVSKKWKRKIDILHINWAHTYLSVREQYKRWVPHMKSNGVILIHDVASHPTEVGKFFHELPLPKYLFPHAGGLGVASQDQDLIELIRDEWNLSHE